MRLLPAITKFMRYIPVLDLLDRQVVHAVRGERANYQPLRSALSASTDPSEVLADLCRWYPFRQVYIADLNALQGRGTHDSQIAILVAQHSACEFWVDVGLGAQSALPTYAAAPNVRLIIASETLTSLTDYIALGKRLGEVRRQILSLDYRRGARLGAQQLMDRPDLWPPHVIGMNLDRVGSLSGPDFELLATLQTQAPHSTIVAAGGVRDARDLELLARQKIDAVLLASALHLGRISATELSAYAE